jgi:hypothetical protein
MLGFSSIWYIKKNTFYGLYYYIPHEIFTTTIITDKIGRWGWCEKEEEEGDRERSSWKKRKKKKKKKRVADLIGQIYIVILERGKWMSQFSSFLNSGLKTWEHLVIFFLGCHFTHVVWLLPNGIDINGSCCNNTGERMKWWLVLRGGHKVAVGAIKSHHLSLGWIGHLILSVGWPNQSCIPYN